MLLFSLSDNSIKILKLSKIVLMDQVSAAWEREIKKGLIVKNEIVNSKGLISEIQTIFNELRVKDRDCAFNLHDERSYILRLSLSKTKDGRAVYELIREQIYNLIPEPFDDLIISYRELDPRSAPGVIQLAAVNQKILEKYAAVFGELGLRARFTVPESYALFALFSPVIGENETVVYLDPELPASNAIVLDKQGVLETFAAQDLEKIKSFAAEKWGRKVDKVLGPDNIIDVLEKYPIPLRFKFEKTQLGKFASLLGLALLLRQKDSLNLI